MNKVTAQSDAQAHRWQQELGEGLQQMRIDLSARQQQQMLEYLQLLAKWNRVFNLTAIREPGEMVSRQLLDSLSILPWVKGARVLDVGTGAGLPGIPLAISLPEVAFTLLDSNGKKTRFVQQAAAQLGLKNVEVINARIESLRDECGFDVITSRAFASLHDFIASTRHLLAAEGCWLAMKGQKDREEGELPAEILVQRHTLLVPGCEGDRHLAEVRIATEVSA
jgi:16S rRNA (guanine527-N7)-methyltransferase